MKITKLEKHARLIDGSVKISVDIEVNEDEIVNLGYEGYDLFPDYLIADLLVAVGREYKGKIKKGRLIENGLRS